MNLLLFSERDRHPSGELWITGRRATHLKTVHGVSIGDTVRVGELGGNRGTAIVREIQDGGVLLNCSLDLPPPAKLDLTLIAALPRPKVLRRLLRTATEFGIPAIHLINSYRVEKSYWQSPKLQEAAIGSALREGLEQAVDTVPPQVHFERRFKPFVEDRLPGLLAGRPALLAHPGNHTPCPATLPRGAVLVMGPEGGFIPYEVDRLVEAGCKPVNLGPRILRVENALAALLGRALTS